GRARLSGRGSGFSFVVLYAAKSAAPSFGHLAAPTAGLAALPEIAGIRCRHRVELPLGGAASHFFFSPYAPALGTTCGAAHLCAGALAVPAVVGIDLPHRFCLARESDHRVGRQKWHHPRRTNYGSYAPAGGRATLGLGSLPPRTDALLVQG